MLLDLCFFSGNNVDIGTRAKSTVTYNPFTLFFINNWAHLEPEFLKFHFKESLVRIRIATLVAASFYAAFGILDAVLIPEKKIIFWAIRYFMVVPVAIGTLVFSFSPRFEKFAQASLFFMCLVGGLGIELMVILARPPVSYSYYAGIILIFITIHTFLPMRFLWASACSWSIVLFYEIIAFWVVDTPVAILINNNFFFVSANILCMLAGYSIELNARRRFFANHLLSLEKAKVSQINQELDLRVKERTRELSFANQQLQKEITDRVAAEDSRMKLEKELNKRHKMEAIGTLAGGIAHDFNNILSAIIGYTELAMDEIKPDAAANTSLNQVLKAGLRAKDLTRQKGYFAGVMESGGVAHE